jgi:tRNA-specific 2-thiouridylase
VVIGLSGGVDSSVAAWMLKESGYEVAGLFMRNWHDTTGLLQSDCHWEDDFMFAEMVAKKLDIQFNFVDLSKSYREKVVDYMFSEYEKGRTPNPDILCNREIKFNSFANEARKLGGDYIATGHYCRKETINDDSKPVHRLLSGIDRNKDQSYFLCQLTQEQLGFAMFPVGEITKPEVRKIADDLGLPTAHRKDSQGICFVGKVHLPTFLQQKLITKQGKIIIIGKGAEFPVRNPGYPADNIIEKELESICKPNTYNVESGSVVGHHEGAHFFTIGQRKGINIGGCKEPLYVIGTDTVQNLLFVGEGDSHPGLFRNGLFIRKDEVHWIRKDLEMRENEFCDLLVRIRYRQPLQKARLYKRSKGIYIVFARPQRGITPGQFAAWYDGEELLGSGVINN